MNDPCLDPPPEAPFPENFRRTVQSETEIAVLNNVGHDDDDGDDDGKRSGRLMVAGYNDSYGFYDNRQGLSGVSYSTNGGKQWIDASGLPPIGVTDQYFGDPVVVVHHRTKTFYYASLYQTAAGFATLSVNRGQFRVAPQQVPVESYANTRCEGNPAAHGIPDPPPFVQERIIWEPPVVAVPPPFLGPNNDAFLDKEWLYVDQKTGILFLTYTRFGADFSTPIELVRSFDGGRTWTPPSIIVPNEDFDFNQATMPVVTPTGRVIVTWFARTFAMVAPFNEIDHRIEAAYSDNCLTPAPCAFTPPMTVEDVNPQGEPLGYNRNRFTILNAPYINVDLGRDDGIYTREERGKRGFGDIFITYFDGKTESGAQCPAVPNPALPCTPRGAGNPFARAADILLSVSTNNGTSYRPPVKVNDDPGNTTHVFPSVQINKNSQVFVTWIDRRKDQPRACRSNEQPLPGGFTRCGNILNDTWGEVSQSRRAGRGGDVRITDVSTDWFTREDAAPDYGDYNSSEVLNFTTFASIWADGRFPPGTFIDDRPPPATCAPAMPPCPDPPPVVRRRATPDAIFSIFRGGGDDDGRGGGGD